MAQEYGFLFSVHRTWLELITKHLYPQRVRSPPVPPLYVAGRAGQERKRPSTRQSHVDGHLGKTSIASRTDAWP